mmetsp:Transcript_12809/g.9286  ORF Transcript_12809/g.9286 Transcript_12809/m.9286 type:complete len:215 (+) Transcript_12809:755-1399(+)|eukprot:CAMPEP_0202966440 /NCGR_PEP_ID=MMETSP1396-20130829/10837_1 /ASSEMBLY_ACC=CAM_ASM_000872 /TAXON_ID= /ORGANISM="Pseudokeronopsis sp., Strain Brazil" /LENGTH=214 /DNA_ID=CAMNT_0049690291 /DNA_START=647 /DNA_END=1291 /DNA_ORIENTATION=+
MEFNFPQIENGTGIETLLPHASREVVDLLSKLLIYNPDNRITASQALKHTWFKELRDQERLLKQQYAGSLTQSSVRGTQNNLVDSLSQNSKHSDDASMLQTDGKNSYLGGKQKFVKTQNKLPGVGKTDGKQQSYPSESEDNNKGLPQIGKVSLAEIGGVMPKGKQKQSHHVLNQSKYQSNMVGQSQSPSQTFFKGGATIQQDLVVLGGENKKNN